MLHGSRRSIAAQFCGLFNGEKKGLTIRLTSFTSMEEMEQEEAAMDDTLAYYKKHSVTTTIHPCPTRSS